MLFGRLAEKTAEILAVPKEIALDLPRIVMTGDREFYCSGYRGLNDFSEEEVRLVSEKGIISVMGKGLVIKSIENEEIIISGTVLAVNFM